MEKKKRENYFTKTRTHTHIHTHSSETAHLQSPAGVQSLCQLDCWFPWQQSLGYRVYVEKMAFLSVTRVFGKTPSKANVFIFTQKTMKKTEKDCWFLETEKNILRKQNSLTAHVEGTSTDLTEKMKMTVEMLG